MTVDRSLTTHLRNAVARKLRRLARTHMELEVARSRLDREMEAVRSRHANVIRRLERRQERVAASLERFCRTHRAQVLREGRKSLSMPCGEIGFRSRPPRVSPADGQDEEAICRRLEAAGRAGFVCVRRRLDRRAVRRAVREGRIHWSELSEMALVVEERPDSFRWSVRTAATAGEGTGV